MQTFSQLLSLNCNCFKRKSPASSKVSLQGLPILHVNHSSAGGGKSLCTSLKSLTISCADWKKQMRRRMGSREQSCCLLGKMARRQETAFAFMGYTRVLCPVLQGAGAPKSLPAAPHPSLVVPGSGLGAGEPSPTAETQIPFAAASQG